MEFKEEILEKILDYVQRTEDFALEQIPQVLVEMIKYYRISSICESIMMVIIMTITAILSYTCIKSPKRDDFGDKLTPNVLAPIFLGFIFFICFIIFCVSMDTLIMSYSAPKFFIIKTLTNLKR